MKTRKHLYEHINFLFFLIIFALLLVIVPQTALAEEISETEETVTKQTSEAIADPSTLNSYLEALTDGNNPSRYSGRVWTDKSVFPGIVNNQKASVEIDGQSYESSDDFLEVFSALGSSESVKGEGDEPFDYVIVLDISTSMGISCEYSNYSQENAGVYDASTKIQKTLNSANSIIDYLLKSHDQNRVGVVLFASKSMTVLPLAHYMVSSNLDEDPYLSIASYGKLSKDNSDKPTAREFTININASRTDGESIDQSVSNEETQMNEQTPSISYQTNLEAGINSGMDLLLSSDPQTLESHTPRMVLLTDGESILFNEVSPFTMSEQEYDSMTLSGNNSPIILETLMNAAYKKTAVERRYNKPFNITSIGVDIESFTQEVKDNIYAICNPKEGFTNSFSGDSPVSSAFDSWQEWCEKDTVTLQIPMGEDINVPFIIDSIPKDNPYGITKEEMIANINYVDDFYEVSAADQEKLFGDIIKELNQKAFHPIDSTSKNGFGDEGCLTYYDPIGEYMSVTDVKALRIFGQNYNLVKNREVISESGESTINYSLDTADGSSLVLNHPGYNDGTQVNLNEIQINVITKPDKGGQFLKVTIPEEALPIIRTDIQLGKIGENGEREILSYSNNLKEQNALPLRIIYCVGINKNYKNDDGTINTDLISPEYFGRDENNEITFYSNNFSNQNYSDLSDSLTKGDALVSFIPSAQNSFYLAQENMPIYNSVETPTIKQSNSKAEDTLVLGDLVTDTNQIDDNKNYYVLDSYYEPENNGKALSATIKEEIVPISGKELNEHSNWYSYIEEEKQTKEADGESKVVALKPGSMFHGNLHDQAKLKEENSTETATLYYGPESMADETNEIHTALGNNGKLMVKDPDEQDEPDEPVTPDEPTDPSKPEDPDEPNTPDKPDTPIEPDKPNNSEEPHETGSPKLSLLKTQKVGDSEFTTEKLIVSEGDYVTYRLELTNSGDADAEEITITDNIPNGLVIDENSITKKGIVEGNKITWFIQKLEPGNTVIVKAGVIIPHKDTTTSWENSALFQDKRQRTPETSNEVEVITESSCMIQKSQSVNGDIITSSPVSVKPGDTITYYLTINNTGNRKNNDYITITDTIPEGLILITESISDNGIISDNKIKWNINLQNFENNFVLSYSAKVIESNISVFRNIGYLNENSENEPPIPSNEVIATKEPGNSSVSTPLDGNPEVTIDKKQAVGNNPSTHDLLEVKKDDEITYILTVSNNGDRPAQNVYVSDPIPDGLEVLVSSISDNGYYDGSRILWNLDRLTPGQNRILNFKVKIPDTSVGSTWVNKASLCHSRITEPILSNEVSLSPIKPEVSLEKTQSLNGSSPTKDPLTVNGSDKVTYYINVKNTGSSDLTDLEVTDEIPSGLTVIPGGISAQSSVENGVITWKIPLLQAEQSQKLHFTVQVPNDTSQNSWENTAYINRNSQDEVQSNTVVINKGTVTASASEVQTGGKETASSAPATPTAEQASQKVVSNPNPALTANPSNTPSTTGTVNQTLSPSATTQTSEAPKTGIENNKFLLGYIALLICAFAVIIYRAYNAYNLSVLEKSTAKERAKKLKRSNKFKTL